MNRPDGARTLDELTALVQKQLNAACVLVTRVTESRQYVLAHAGRSLPSWFTGCTSLDYSICQHSVAMDFPLVIDDTFSHPLMRGNLTVEELSVAAYIGAPVHVREGLAIGTLCAVEFHQRRWPDEEIQYMIDAAQVADTIIAELI